MRVRSARTYHGVSGRRNDMPIPRPRACGSIIDWHSSITSSSETGSSESVSLPDSMSARSRISLIRSSRYQPDLRIWSMCFFCVGVGAGEPVSRSWAKPRIALSGVRSSWLMPERKSDFAWLAFSAASMAAVSSVSTRLRTELSVPMSR